MTARFTRKGHDGEWRIAVDAPDAARTSVEVRRKGGASVTMALGACLGPHHKLEGFWTYEIDRARGGKAPTSGRLGKNAGTSARTVQTQPLRIEPEPEPAAVATTAEPVYQAPEPFEPAEYAKRAEVQSALDSVAADIGAQRKDFDALRDEVRNNAPVVVNVPVRGTVEPKTVHGAHAAFAEVLADVSVGNHVFLVGPAGTGKTHLAGQVAEALGRDFYICGALMTKHEVIGYQTATGEYMTTAARQAYEHGGLLLWDEADSSLAAALVAVNAMLANDTYTFPDVTVKRHPEFVVIAAGNTYGSGANREYVGRLPLDAATLDRFSFIEVGYDASLEQRIALAEFEAFGAYVDTDRALAERWVSIVQDARAAAEIAAVRFIASPRASIMGARLIAAGQSDLERIAAKVLWKGLGDDEKAQVRAAMVEAV